MICFTKHFHTVGYKVETQAVVRKIWSMSQTVKQLQLWFLVSPLSIRMTTSRRKDLQLPSSWHENMGLGKNNSGETQRKHGGKPHCSAEVYRPTAQWEGTHEDMAQPRSSSMCHLPPHLLLMNHCRNTAYLQLQKCLRCHAGQNWKRQQCVFSRSSEGAWD